MKGTTRGDGAGHRHRHELPDGEDKPGVLVRFTMKPGGEEWVPREKLGKVLVRR